jgi:glycosyltransferase involved in cell wall biosynthesis
MTDQYRETRRRVLFVCHEATLTGAPMNLLHLVGWLTEHTAVEPVVLVLEDGALTHRFEQLCEVRVLDADPVTRTVGLAHRGLRRLGSRRVAPLLESVHLRPQLIGLGSFDLVYVNSTAGISVVDHLRHEGPVVAHVHELDVAISTMWPRDRERLRSRPGLYIAASQAVAQAIERLLAPGPGKIRTHYEFIDTQQFAGEDESISNPSRLREVERTRRSARIPTDAAVVMGVGTVDWRKGPDLFVQLAAELRRQSREPVHFVWVGGDLTGIDMVRLHADMRRAGTDHVHFVGTQPDPRPWFRAADVLALTSREDPFPLVCLEHAAMGHPIVTYRNGGMVELLEAAGPEAAAGIVDYLDVGAMARRILELLGDERLRSAAANQLMTATISRHDVGVVAPQLWADVEQLMSGRPSAGPG